MARYVFEGTVKEILFSKDRVGLKLAPNAEFVVSRKEAEETVRFAILQPLEKTSDEVACGICQEELMTAELDDRIFWPLGLSNSVRVELDVESGESKKISIGAFKFGSKSYVVTKLIVK